MRNRRKAVSAQVTNRAPVRLRTAGPHETATGSTKKPKKSSGDMSWLLVRDTMVSP